MKYLDGLMLMSVGQGELLDSHGHQGEFVTPSAEAVPAEIPVPVPMEVGAIVFLERQAAIIGTMTAAGNFGIMQHRAPGSKVF